jgi:UDP-N-acetylglucosamine--N-acetylmuramyl-(pentapeptide) pyrophosphoryl-undecaprenol N-acetylglucosamine transferase
MTPAIAVLSEFRKRGFTNFLWIGQKYNQKGNKNISVEYETITKEGIKFIELNSGKIQSFSKFLKYPMIIFTLFKVLWATLKVLAIFIKEKPAVVVSFGGFNAVPVALVAKLTFTKLYTHEQTMVTGVANSFISKLANKVFVSWETSKKKSRKYILSGNPIRKEIFYVKSDELTSDFDKKKLLLFVTGGNQGSHIINTLIFEKLTPLLDIYNIIHQTGNSSVTGDFQKALEIRKSLSAERQISYIPIPYIDKDNIGEILNKSSVIVSRSGANSVYEFLALAKMCILIPIPWSLKNEQMKNAEFAVEVGIARILPENKLLTSELLYKNLLFARNQIMINKYWDDRPRDTIEQLSKSSVRLDAASVIVDEIVG